MAASTSTPVIFLLLFRYVFGGAINVGHTGYANYLIAGIFVQTVAITALAAGTGVAQDLQSGLIDRFRSLPIAQSAVLSGRVVATLVRSVVILAIVAAFGLLVGFRPEGDPIEWLAALGILLLFGLAMSWIGVAVGLLVRNVEAVQNVTMTAVFPLTFLSSAFVPPQTMPAILRLFVANQPMTQVVDAVHGLILNHTSASAEIASWSGALRSWSCSHHSRSMPMDEPRPDEPQCRRDTMFCGIETPRLTDWAVTSLLNSITGGLGSWRGGRE